MATRADNRNKPRDLRRGPRVSTLRVSTYRPDAAVARIGGERTGDILRGALAMFEPEVALGRAVRSSYMQGVHDTIQVFYDRGEPPRDGWHEQGSGI